MSRAKSYFLVSSMVGNSLTFAIGPKLLDDEEAPDKDKGQKEQQQEEHEHANGRREGDEEHAHPVNCSGRTAEQQEEHVNETTTLLPDRLAHSGEHLEEAAFDRSNEQ